MHAHFQFHKTSDAGEEKSYRILPYMGVEAILGCRFVFPWVLHLTSGSDWPSTLGEEDL